MSPIQDTPDLHKDNHYHTPRTSGEPTVSFLAPTFAKALLESTRITRNPNQLVGLTGLNPSTAITHPSLPPRPSRLSLYMEARFARSVANVIGHFPYLACGPSGD
ncbi:hypothetical protein M405DRAFT_827120 [Rhizopogon salebrosus TDB-379]|nr:hypothetical protein M405DRAFT_827120 [Rhizopogon salebrosus TDB-379]